MEVRYSRNRLIGQVPAYGERGINTLKETGKIKMFTCLVLAGLLVFPAHLWADTKSEDDADEKDILKVEFSEIGPLVEIRNVDVGVAVDSVEDAEEARGDGISAIDAQISSLNNLINSLALPDPAPGSDPPPSGGSTLRCCRVLRNMTCFKIHCSKDY
jgi:hypothetical protein